MKFCRILTERYHVSLKAFRQPRKLLSNYLLKAMIQFCVRHKRHHEPVIKAEWKENGLSTTVCLETVRRNTLKTRWKETEQVLKQIWRLSPRNRPEIEKMTEFHAMGTVQ